MKVTHMGHSGFAVELDKTVLVFDYYIGEIPEFDPEKEIFVLASHFHQDHFNWKIYPAFRKYPNVTYILSRDIKRQYNRGYFLRQGVSESEYDTQTIFMGACKEEKLQGLSICTFKSTDCGVAWLIRAEGKWFYHAGDLNWWDWDRYTPEEREHWGKAYREEVDRAADILKRESAADVNRGSEVVAAAFVVLDGHMDPEPSIRSFDYFARKIQADAYYPMHYWEHTERVKELLEATCSEPYRDRVVDETERVLL